ncbi:MAG: PilZ domain-containing protein [Acidobacteriota bacterium]|nr:PilZ domain-containing protein [Acidobacteriota bacterium]
MIRKLISRFNKSFAERMVAERRRHSVPIKVWFEPDKTTGKLKLPIEKLTISGETKDLSVSGIAFIVSSIRIKENYLVGEGCTLNAEIDFPTGKVRMQIVGQRYEQVGQHISTARYLIGAQIIQISEEDREVYDHFLRYGDERKKGSLAFGVDKT